MTVILIRKIFNVTNSITSQLPFITFSWRYYHTHRQIHLMTTSQLPFITFSWRHYHTHQQIRRMTSSNHILTLENLNPNIIAMEYAVRGPLVIRAMAIEKELNKQF
ncbi:hypothetical protein LOAG_14583 [Loa loa]|uniref:Uncharacterized protein n=1 Tax=Loa loa TaxID=7209 RepID=A0A1S0TIG2_LOALO|nr:hypothetical protein LOAG_14583 [Loa loa]EFO13943.2 hypothetical protein LOAG_14583 [Loa loa]